MFAGASDCWVWVFLDALKTPVFGASHHFVIPGWTVLCHLLASRMLPKSRVPKRARVFVALNILFVRCVVVQPKGQSSECGFSVAIAVAGFADRLFIEIRLRSCATSRIGCKVPHVLCDLACVCFAEPGHVPMMSNMCMYCPNMCCGHCDLREPYSESRCRHHAKHVFANCALCVFFVACSCVVLVMGD